MKYIPYLAGASGALSVYTLLHWPAAKVALAAAIALIAWTIYRLIDMIRRTDALVGSRKEAPPPGVPALDDTLQLSLQVDYLIQECMQQRVRIGALECRLDAREDGR